MTSEIHAAFMRARGLSRKQADEATALFVQRAAQVINDHGGIYTVDVGVMSRLEHLKSNQSMNVDLTSMGLDLIRGITEAVKSG